MPERPRARRAHRLRLPDGAAAHRRGEGRLHRQHAGAPAGRRDRRRPDRDRHRDRVARLLPGAGREVPRALRDARARSTARRGAQRNGTTRRREIAEEFLAHARAMRAEREAGRGARDARRAILELLQRWGGVTIAYRRRLIDSPSYTLNHEEVEKALEEGIVFAEGLTPLAVEVDEYGAATALRLARQRSATTASGARTARRGSRRETILDRRRHAAQHRARARGRRALRARRQATSAPATRTATRSSREYAIAKPARCRRAAVARRADGRFMSYFGDLHPSFFGNVVKAMGSAKQGYPVVSPRAREARARRATARATTPCIPRARSTDELRATVHEVERLTPTIVEVVVRAPLGRAPLPAGPVLPAAELRDARRASPSGTRARDGRPRAHRRVGRPRAGARLDDRAGDGRLVATCARS